MIRLVALVATGTRSAIDAVFGSDKTAELAYAGQLAQALRPAMLLLGDRNFATYKFFTTVTGTGADFLIRGKTGNGAMKLPVTSRLCDGSYLVNASSVQVRVIDATVTITTEADTRTSQYQLITTLLGPGSRARETADRAVPRQVGDRDRLLRTEVHNPGRARYSAAVTPREPNRRSGRC